ncbi:MAG: TIGR01777 family oxidoreductase [Rhodothermales bacterium]|nr:TIGR01777 family oxidoreductase [Rhodothermales bacterium]
MSRVTAEYRSPLPVSADEAFAWHARPGAFERLTPPWTEVTLERFDSIRDGQRAVLRLHAGPFSTRWVAEHHGYIEGRQFCDRQVKGPFRAWDHTHRFEPDGPEASTLVDHIEYALPLGRLGALAGGRTARAEIDRMFGYRHRITQNDLALHRHYNPERQRLRIAVSGASGLIGSALVPFLTTGGHDVLRLVRTRTDAEDAIYWNPETGEIEAEKLEGLGAIIHLAGEPVYALRWTEAKKRRILRSRAEGTRLLAETLARLKHPPRALLSASAIGYYGDRGDVVLEEEARPGTGFLADVCRAWEAAALPAAGAGIRTAQLRIGIVLSPRGGPLGLLLPWFRLGLGGRVGSGAQYLSWIALDDVLGALYHLLWTDLDGPVNLTAPAPVPMRDFTRTLAHVLRRPAAVRVPAAAARAAAGEIADAVLLASTRAIPARLQQSGYSFLFEDLGAALRHQLGASIRS